MTATEAIATLFGSFRPQKHKQFLLHCLQLFQKLPAFVWIVFLSILILDVSTVNNGFGDAFLDSCCLSFGDLDLDFRSESPFSEREPVWDLVLSLEFI